VAVTVYVDARRQPSRAGRLAARWSHPVADDPAELHTVAARLRLHRAWIQDAGGDSWRHHDVTDSERRLAIRLGEVPVGSRQRSARTGVVRAFRPPAAARREGERS
jgi:hypothetical protein